MSAPHFTRTHAAPRASASRSLPIVRRISQWLQERRASRRLHAFSDAQLKDIGLSRVDIDDVVRYGHGWRSDLPDRDPNRKG